MPGTMLITGASTGIGRATAERFRARGWQVAATMRTPDRSAEWTGPLGLFCPRLDVTDPASIDEAVGATLDRFGRVDVLVNNAGYALMGPLEGLTDAQLDRQFRTNVLGLAAVTRRVLPAMRANGGGVVVNISSIGGRMAFPMTAAYHATKFAVEGLSESLRFELRPFGIRVKVVEPGGIRTDFIGRGIDWASHPAYEGMVSAMRRFMARTDTRLPGPEGVAKVIYRAATDGSDRLRYPALPGPFLAMHGLLPDRIWRSLLGLAVRRQAGQSTPAVGGEGRSRAEGGAR